MASFDIGIDLGTTKIIIYRSNIGIVLNEPSIVAYNEKTQSVLAVGKEAYDMLGKTPEYIVAVKPLKDGVISSHQLTELMIKEYINRVSKSFFIKPRIIICIPSVTTDVERRAVAEAAMAAGARKIYLIEEPIAAAIGAGIDIFKPNGNLIIDIGGGTTDIAVISLGGIVCSESIRSAGNKVDEELIKFLTARHKLSIGQRTAERLKKEIACVWQPDESKSVLVKGRNLLTGYPQQIEITQTAIYGTVRKIMDKIVDALKRVLEVTPPELTGDIWHNGVSLTGGGSLIKGLPEFISAAIGISVRVVENPVEVVSIGTGKAYEFIEEFHDGFTDATRFYNK